MPDETSVSGFAGWTRALELNRLQPSQPVAVKLHGKHIALFLHQGTVLACNNRCPHEGYPLVEGALDAQCVLTCNWHNWKFDLKTGTTLYGGDNLRVYPVRLAEGAVWIDTRDPPAELRIEQALAHLDVAMDEFDTARIAREVARLEKAGADPALAVTRAICATYDRLRDGMTHAYAGAEVWLRLRDTVDGAAPRLACASEALSHIAFDTLREKSCPYTDARLPWQTQDFAAALEAQDEHRAAALLNDALHQGLRFDDLEPALATAALAHYSDFGHTLIYLLHVRRLIERLGAAVERPLLLSWLRSTIYATREDLLPDFRGYAETLERWPGAAQSAGSQPVAENFEGSSVRQALDAALTAAAQPPLVLYHALVEAAARQLLRFDERHALRTDNSVADNVGWLDFSHALTFGNALRLQCARQPSLWPQGLLQLACFVGRNRAYLDAGLPAQRAIKSWRVDDETEFNVRATAAIIDHGIGMPIFPVHRLKTWSAVLDEVATAMPESTKTALLAATNRLLAVQFKQRHTLRTAQQALGFVGRED